MYKCYAKMISIKMSGEFKYLNQRKDVTKCYIQYSSICISIGKRSVIIKIANSKTVSINFSIWQIRLVMYFTIDPVAS